MTVTPAGTLSQAVDAPTLSFVTGGASPWHYQTAMYDTAPSAAEAGSTPDGQTSWMETTLTGPGSLAFDWRISSQTGSDYLHVYVDGVDQGGALSGLSTWVPRTVSIGSGTHIVRWSYEKDGAGSGNSDTGWVDNVSWSSYGPTPFPTFGMVRPGKIYSYPNPFHTSGTMKLQFIFEPAGNAVITIYDWAATKIGVLTPQQTFPSAGYANWDGYVAGGGQVPPAVYFAILKTDKGTMSCKFTVIR